MIHLNAVLVIFNDGEVFPVGER